MFTGIIDHCGQIKNIEIRADNYLQFTIKSDFEDLKLGESIAIDGICLTVTSHQQGCFTVDLSSETIDLTLAAHYAVGDTVNLERALRLTDRLGGHFVTGHVDALAQVSKILPGDGFLEIYVNQIKDGSSFLVKKGSIAINGVSLTINEVIGQQFKIMLIPHTLSITNLSHLKEGSFVNLEYDYLAKLVINQMQREKA